MSTTLNIYSHITDTMQQQAAARIDREIAGLTRPFRSRTQRTRQVTVKQPISRQSRNLSRIRARYASPVRVA